MPRELSYLPFSLCKIWLLREPSFKSFGQSFIAIMVILLVFDHHLRVFIIPWRTSVSSFSQLTRTWFYLLYIRAISGTRGSSGFGYVNSEQIDSKTVIHGVINQIEDPSFSDLSQTLKNFSKDSWKTLGRLLGKSSNAFYSRILPMKSSGSLPKSFSKSEDSWKTLVRLLGKSSNVFYARRLPAKSSGSLLRKVVQKNDAKWSPSLYMLRNDI
ncbi:hypothetical protein YC2023_116509 [Brassica napus]